MNEYDLSAYLSVFLDEAEEQIQILDKKILELEKNPFNMEIVQSIFRAAHTLKGSSASMGFEKLKTFTHHLENVFDQIRHSKVQVTEILINVLFESIDLIKEMKEAIINNQLEEVDITKGINSLEDLSILENYSDNNTNDSIELEEFQINILSQGILEGFKGFNVSINLDENCPMKNVRAFMIHNALSEIGEIIATIPSIQTMEQDENFSGKMNFYILTKTPKNEILKMKEKVSDINYINVEEYNEQNRTSEEIKPVITPKETNKISPTIRVDIDKLEHLMGLVGELVINQTRLVDVRGRFSEMDIRHENEFTVLNEVTTQLGLVISELQDGMMQTRMLPIEQLFNRLPRLVRDTSLKANKEINFEMVGNETELDRTLIEEISDPLIHLIRNAIDHGIEHPVEREQLGKSRVGNVLIEAKYEEKHVVIRIEDDGRGIDPVKIKEVSIDKGLISAEEASKLSDKEAIHLIFKSGISTAKKVTDISGRGVGMDIVKSHIEKINGVIDIDSIVGKGTTFTIKLPLTLTLSIIRALLVKFAEKTYAIPLVNVLEIIRINKSDIQKLNDQEVGMVRGSVLPLIRMKDKLNIHDKNSEIDKKTREFVVVVGFAEKRVGIIVDKTIGNQEIVTKSLGSYIGTVPFISGATIMGDANLALILDVPLIVNEFGTQFTKNEVSIINQNNEEEKQLVTFKIDSEEYSIDIQKAKDIIPITNITRIVEAPEEILGIINLRDKTIPVMDLRKRLNLKPISYSKKARIIVVEYKNCDVGILVDEVTQVFKSNDLIMEQNIENNQFNQSKLVGNITNFNNRIILNLDLEELFNKVSMDFETNF